MTTLTNPVCDLPPPIVVHRHIGRLLQELRLARRLLKLSRTAHEQLITEADRLGLPLSTGDKLTRPAPQAAEVSGAR